MVNLNLEEHLKNQVESEDLRLIVLNLADSCKGILSQLSSTFGSRLDTSNHHGDLQTSLDVIADEIILKNLQILRAGSVWTYLSEEQKDRVTIHKNGKFSVAADPVDGSSHQDLSVSIGSIFGIYHGDIQHQISGREALAGAVYAIYANPSILVYSEKKGVHLFVLENGRYKFLETMSIPNEKNLLVAGGLRADWPRNHRAFVERLEIERYGQRNAGPLVVDIHRVLKLGGIYAYPLLNSDSNTNVSRFLFETLPMSFIVEQAGGTAIDSNGNNILDIAPNDYRGSSLYAGRKAEVKLAREYLGRNPTISNLKNSLIQLKKR